MHPILFTIGNFPIGTYGVLVALSALAALGLAKMLAPEAGLDPERMVDLFVYALLAAFVGAKVALIIGDFRAFSADPLGYLVENLRSFGAFYGGFIAAVLVAGLFLRKHRIPFWPAADVTAICLALAQSMGRWGCFFAGCCYGKPTDLPWGMVFPAVPLCADGTHIHPWPSSASSSGASGARRCRARYSSSTRRSTQRPAASSSSFAGTSSGVSISGAPCPSRKSWPWASSWYPWDS